MYRLDSNFPSLAIAFRAAPLARRRNAAVVATEMALGTAGVHDPDVRAALESLQAGASVDPGLRVRIEGLAAKLDESYFDAVDEGKESASLELFSKARATAALVYALSEDAESLHEAIYEATVAVEDAANVAAAVKRALD